MTTPEIVSVTLMVGTIGFAAYGAWRGCIRQLGSVAAFLFGFLGARLFAPKVAAALALPQMVCYLAVFALIFLIVIMLARILHLTVKMLLMGPVNSLLGAVIGAAKWVLLTSLLINLFLMCVPDSTAFCAPVSQWVARFAPRLFGLAQTYIN